MTRMKQFKKYFIWLIVAILFLLTYIIFWPRLKFVSGFPESSMAQKEAVVVPEAKRIKSDAEWKKILTPEEYRVLREKGTERAFTGRYHDFKGKGVYVCAACGQPLFRSDEKFDSGTGWPSFWNSISKEAVEHKEDSSFFIKRTEVLCGACQGHLGHVFDDGPPPTGKRYCINSIALKFKETESQK